MEEKTSKSTRRAKLAALSCLLAALVFLSLVHQHRPVEDWIVWRFVRAFGLSVGFAFSCLSVGRRVLRVVRPGGLWLAEIVQLSLALGVVIFYLGTFIGGLLGIQGAVFFVVLPLALSASGFGCLRDDFRRLRRHRLIPSTPRAVLPSTTVELGAWLVLAGGAALLYLQILAPENVGYDATWYHLPLAEDFARRGVHRFDDGWYLAAYPGLASTLYAWAFQQPFAGTYDRVVLASHLEYVLFLATLAGVTVVARRLLRRRRLRFASAAVFLFPGIFIYDSNLVTGADHVLASFAAPLAIATLSVLRHPSLPRYVLLSFCAAGAALTKYQAIYLLLPVALAVITRSIVARSGRGLLSSAALSLLLTTPHWLKNAIYYGDPLYPLLHRVFSPRPFHEGAARLVSEVYTQPGFTPQGSFAERLSETLRALVTFSFEPHDIWDFHHGVPVFGSLLTLLVVPLAFASKTSRLFAAIAAVHLGVAVFWWTNHQERFLQCLVPWMAAAVAGALVRLWALGLVARVPLAMLVGLQLIWAVPMPFYPRTGDLSSLALAGRQLSAGLRGESRALSSSFTGLHVARKQLPEAATVLFHGERSALGLGRAFLVDEPGYQGATDYALFTRVGQVRRHLESLGATHVLYPKRRFFGSLDRAGVAREVVFHAFALRETTPLWKDGRLTLRALSKRASSGDDRIAPVALFGCKTNLPRGLFEVAALRKKQPKPLRFDEKDLDSDAESALARAGAVFVESDCKRNAGLAKKLPKAFRFAGEWDNGRLLVRVR